ncbi:MAG: PQQ-binding-like beta-propeller repeat protein [Pirellulales bacterium]
MKSFHFLLTSLVVLMFNSVLRAEDAYWPQWRGPHRDGVSTETGLLQQWPEGGPSQAWLFKECGLGYSGPAIVGERLYILGARNGEEQLICLLASDGKELWSASIGSILRDSMGDGPRSTPTVDGEFVYALGGQGNLVCFSTRDGSQVWSKAMQDLGGTVVSWTKLRPGMLVVYRKDIVAVDLEVDGARSRPYKRSHPAVTDWQPFDRRFRGSLMNQVRQRDQGATVDL